MVEFVDIHTFYIFVIDGVEGFEVTFEFVFLLVVPVYSADSISIFLSFGRKKESDGFPIIGGVKICWFFVEE